MSILLKGATVIDGKGGIPQSGTDIWIEGERINSIGQKLPIPPDTQVIDLAGKWLLPGLIDMHIHIAFPQVSAEPITKDAEIALCAAQMVHVNLQAGVTTVRDVGAQHAISLSVRNAVKAGMIPGSRVFAAGYIICSTGGHGSGDAIPAAREADGPDDMRRAVREQWRAGADLIKFTLNGAHNVVELTREEVEAIVDDAHRLGYKVACHASILPAAQLAVDAGVDTIEHGCDLDDETARKMADKGITLVATIVAFQALKKAYMQYMPDSPLIKVTDQRISTHQKSVNLALKYGAPIVTGTDVVVPYPTLAPLADEMEYLVQWGLSPMQAIQAATSTAAQALGKAKELGTLESGKLADLVVVDRDPLKDITAMKKVNLVIQGGKVVG
jgi:imidazolonepropionase-like amidohydrolase